MQGLNKDKVTTILGVVGAGIMAAQPILTGVQTQSLHSNDWLQLGTAVAFSLLGYFTNKQ